MIDTIFHKTDFGELIIGTRDQQLVLCDWRFRKMRENIDRRICSGLHDEYRENHSEMHETVIAQLSEYFRGDRREFSVPLLMVGTDFQKSVWNALLNIPYGKTMTYHQLSKSLNNTLAIRAVASANGANALSILVPCHRIIGSNGEMVGYAGGTSVKKKLLALENQRGNIQTELFTNESEN